MVIRWLSHVWSEYLSYGCIDEMLIGFQRKCKFKMVMPKNNIIKIVCMMYTHKDLVWFKRNVQKGGKTNTVYNEIGKPIEETDRILL